MQAAPISTELFEGASSPPDNSFVDNGNLAGDASSEASTPADGAALEDGGPDNDADDQLPGEPAVEVADRLEDLDNGNDNIEDEEADVEDSDDADAE